MDDSRFYQGLGLGDIHRKVRDGRRLNLEDGLKLFACPEVMAVGALAHQVRTRLHGNAAYYIVNRHVNYSNICVNSCRFCAFGKKQGDPLAFELTVPGILEKIRAGGYDRLTEIHVVGGCHPDLPLSYYEDLLRELRALCPGAILKAFTAVEIEHFARIEGMSTRSVLLRLKAAGLAMMPGGGAEIFSPRVRKELCPSKTAGRDWLEIVREAHQLGIRTNATMLYGHIETIEERLEHLVALRELQDETGGLLCFIPLPFQTANNGLSGITPTTGLEDLRTIAISRLMLDNVPHVKAYWIMLTVKLAQVALYFGADDFDGTVIEEKIGHMAGAKSEAALTRAELEGIIREGGFEPIERNSFFERIRD